MFKAKVREINKAGLLASADVTIQFGTSKDDNLTIQGFLVHAGKKEGDRPWVTGPSVPRIKSGNLVKENGKNVYDQIIICKKVVWDIICKEVIRAYEKEVDANLGGS